MYWNSRNHILLSPYISNGTKIGHVFLTRMEFSCVLARFVTWDAGSIPEYDTGIFHKRNHSGRPLDLWSTQPLTEISTMNISWGVKATST